MCSTEMAFYVNLIQFVAIRLSWDTIWVKDLLCVKKLTFRNSEWIAEPIMMMMAVMI